MTPRIGLNLLFLVPGETGGMETYARELVSALLEEAPELRLTAFLSREAAADSTGPWRDAECVTVPVHARRRTDRVRAEQLLLPRLARKQGVDLVHSLASTGPSWGGFRRVVTIHDVIYRIHPEAHSRIRARGMSLLVPLAARRSERIIVPSTTTRDDVTRLLHVDPGTVDVVPEGVRAPARAAAESPEETRLRLDLGARRVVLTLSAKRPHKNIPRLLEAIALIPPERRPVLLVPGYATEWEGDLRRRVEALGIVADARFLGWVPEAELEALYAVSSCFVFPSLYEGFGLPVLEAMARGIPVACSDRAALPEVAGGAARLFDPERPDAIAEAIEALLFDRDEAERLVAAGYDRAAAMTWAETGRQTAAVYRRVLNLPATGRASRSSA